MYLPKHIPSALSDKEASVLYATCMGAKVLEIGSLFGYSTIIMAQSARVVFSVDPHEGYPEADPKSTLMEYCKNISSYKNIVPIIAKAENVVHHLGNFDVAFIDAMGTYDCTKQLLDLVKYIPTVLVHDYGHGVWNGATRAVNEICVPKVVDTLAIIRKKV